MMRARSRRAAHTAVKSCQPRVGIKHDQTSSAANFYKSRSRAVAATVRNKFCCWPNPAEPRSATLRQQLRVKPTCS